MSDFYERLPSFTDFLSFHDERHYHAAPLDWWVVVTDIEGSTEAIRKGRYRDVNLLGAATITTALNVCGRAKVPFVFGGDGATLLLPPELRDAVAKALAGTKVLAESMFGLRLRIGMVPIAKLHKHGGDVWVAKHEIAAGNHLAMLRGAGIGLAERWVKKGGPNGESYQIAGDAREGDALMRGLSCRWQPLRSKNGLMLSLLVQAAGERSAEAGVYRDVLADLEHVLLSIPAEKRSPVAVESLRGVRIWSSALKEARFGGRRGLRYGVVVLLKTIQFLGLGALLKLNVRIGRFSPDIYKRETVANADYRKFDGMIRMVLDCEEAQVEQIRARLEEKRRQGRLFYGLHTSREALMTCMVFSPFNNEHVHFIDGADGGYAAAATELKAQLKARGLG